MSPCPIPVGWTMRVWRTERKDGLAITATNARGRSFTMELHADLPPDDTPVEVTLPNGERAVIDKTIDIHLSEETKLAFLWTRMVERVRTEDLLDQPGQVN